MLRQCVTGAESREGRLEVVGRLWCRRGKIGWAPLQLATRWGHLDVTHAETANARPEGFKESTLFPNNQTASRGHQSHQSSRHPMPTPIPAQNTVRPGPWAG